MITARVTNLKLSIFFALCEVERGWGRLPK